MPGGPITRYEADGGVRIYGIPVRAFSALIAHVYLVIAGDYIALIDTGSGIGDSNDDLQAGMAALRDEWGEKVGWADISRIIITHAHVDHYGGLRFVTSQSSAPVAVHRRDRRVLTNHEERLTLTSRALASFLRRAGVSEARQSMLMTMYSWSKGLFHSIEVETILRDGDLIDGLFLVHHTPGHCPGQICLQIGNVLFSADHVLSMTSPHMAPESITPSTGLEHYLQALHKIIGVHGIRLTLGGHEAPIHDLYGRVAQIEASHKRKLERVLDACAEPHTISELTDLIYPGVRDYHELLALEEIGAHVEYLDQHGELAIANLDDVASDEHVAPRYRKI